LGAGGTVGEADEAVVTAAAEVEEGAAGLFVVPSADGEAGAAAAAGAEDDEVVVEELSAFDSCDVAAGSEGTTSHSYPSVFGGGSVAEMACRSLLRSNTDQNKRLFRV
jgi:hypothetical protein